MCELLLLSLLPFSSPCALCLCEVLYKFSVAIDGCDFIISATKSEHHPSML